MPEENELRQQICDAGKRLYDRFFIAANDDYAMLCHLSFTVQLGKVLLFVLTKSPRAAPLNRTANRRPLLFRINFQSFL